MEPYTLPIQRSHRFFINQFIGRSETADKHWLVYVSSVTPPPIFCKESEGISPLDPTFEVYFYDAVGLMSCHTAGLMSWLQELTKTTGDTTIERLAQFQTLPDSITPNDDVTSYIIARDCSITEIAFTEHSYERNSLVQIRVNVRCKTVEYKTS